MATIHESRIQMQRYGIRLTRFCAQRAVFWNKKKCEKGVNIYTKSGPRRNDSEIVERSAADIVY